MKNNYFSSKYPKMVVIALLLLLGGLFANKVAAQNIPTSTTTNDVLVWTGTVSSDWNDIDNWYVQSRATTGVAGASEYPGQDQSDDWAYIPSDGTNAPKIPTGLAITVGRLFVTNQFNAAGGTLTIDSGGTLTVSGATVVPFSLNGGNVINNGALSITTTSAGSTGFPVNGFTCGNPSILPAVATEWGYSGSGTLSINLPNANLAASAAISVTGNSGATVTPTNNANVTYKLVFNNNPSISFNQATILSIAAVRAAGGNNANKLIIGGTGFTIGTVGSPSIGSLISLGGGASVTVESETTLTLNSVISNLNSGITGFSASTFATNLTNKGTINIQGASTRSGMGFSTGASATASVYNISNEGILNVNLNAVTPGHSAYNVGNGGGGTANAGSVVNLTNTSTGVLTFKNTSTVLGSGNSIYCTSAGEGARTTFTNDGIVNLEGTVYNFGSKATLINNGTLNSNSEFRSFTAITNNVAGNINFARTAATATTRLVTFTVDAAVTSGAVGSNYTGDGNTYAVVIQKFGSGTTLSVNVLSGATVPATGTLTRTTGTGAASIVYTAVSIPALNNALVGTSTNSGTINTDTESNLNIISGVTTTADSVIAPGGATGYGIASFAAATKTILGKLTLQVAGNTAAGVDYDQITNLTTDGGFDITGAILDVTGISGTATPVDIILANGAGTIAGPFASVEGLTPGWSVDYSTAGKVQLINEPALGTPQFADAKFSYYPNPTRSQLNVFATKNISTVELFNILGQKVQSINVNANQKQLDISNLQNGVYLMEVTIENRKESFKIMKQ